jgi:pimeloyl-ACP methyl ester carboxylesterase
VPSVVADGIDTRYEIEGSGPDLLMFSPGGFNSALENWRTHGLYRRINLLDQLAQLYRCITFDRRESGQAGGRLERISWRSYVDQAADLLDELGVDAAHLIGACVGCSSAAAFAVAHPDRVLSLTLYSPAGGSAYRRRQHARFASHLAYVEEHGLTAVAELAAETGASFSDDGRVGPWSSVLARDPGFADEYRRFDRSRYLVMVNGLARLMFDRDTVPGVEPEDLALLDLPALIVPGEDSSHATSAARYLQECLPVAEYWDVRVADQTAQTAPARVLAFLDAQR